MTNETNYRTKANAVFFAAIMVVSMVAVGFAAAPAAAVDGDDTIEFEEQDLSDDGEVTATITDGNNSTPVDGSVVVTYNDGSDEIVAGVSDVSEEGEVTIEIEDADGFPGDHTAHVTNTSASAQTVGEPVDASGVQDSATALVNDEDVDRVVADGDLHGNELVFQGQTLLVTGLNASANPTLQERVDDETTRTRAQLSTNAQGNVIVETENRAEGDYFLSGAGSSGTSSNTFEVIAQDLSVEFDEDEVDNEGDTNVDFDVESDLRSDYSLTITEADESLDAEDLEQIFGDLDASESDDNEVTTDADIEDGTYSANFSEINADDYEFEFEVVDTTASDTASITVNEGEEGDVSLGEQIVNENQGDVAEVTMEFDDDVDEGTLVIGDEEDVGYQGNVTVDADGEEEVTIRFNTYTAGMDGDASASDNNVVSIADADDSDAEITSFSQNEVREGDAILGTGDYDLSVAASGDAADTLENPDTLGTLVIEPRETTNQQIWTASSSTVDDILDADEDEQVDELTSQIENDAVTQTDSIAYDEDADEGDVVIHQFEASGLSGLLESTGEDDEAAQVTDLLDNGDGIDDDDSLDLRIRETESSASANAERKQLQGDALANAEFVLVSEETDQIFVAYNIEDTNVEEGEEYDARFRVQDERLLDISDDDREDYTTTELKNEFYQSVNAAFGVEEATFDFAQDPYNVTNAEGQVVEGTTNVAPGSEVTVRVRSDSGTSPSFIKTAEDVNVGADGSWNAEFDFSNQNVDDEFTITIRNTILDEDPEVDGMVVEQVDEPDDDDSTDDDSTDDDSTDDDSTDDDSTDDDSTDDDSTDDDSTDDDSTDDSTEDDSSSEDDSTEDDTPGFGAIVALVALIAAALLATRRNE